ncbi:MAG TPA: GAP family protein [Gaiellaceae bacterium]|nr:GAP family protein [Gaiellaceae bacterium]
MTWIHAELALTALAAMLSPTTLTFSVLALVVGDRPLRTGVWFYLGALTATLAVGIAAAFVIGDAAASSTSTPKTWVAVLDVIAAVAILAWVIRIARSSEDPLKMDQMFDRMSGLATAPILAITGAGAALANPGGFIPIALKDISETDPSAYGYAIQWLFFTLVSLLPLAVALLLLVVARDWALRVLGGVRRWLERHGLTIALVILVLLAASLLRNGIAGLTS